MAQFMIVSILNCYLRYTRFIQTTYRHVFKTFVKLIISGLINISEKCINCLPGGFYAEFALLIIIGIAGIVFLQMYNRNIIVQNIRNRIQIGDNNVVLRGDDEEQ